MISYVYRKLNWYFIFVCVVYYWNDVFRFRYSVFRFRNNRIYVYSFIRYKDCIFDIKKDASGEFVKYDGTRWDVGDRFSVPFFLINKGNTEPALGVAFISSFAPLGHFSCPRCPIRNVATLIR